MKRTVVALALIAAFGVAKLPFETQLTKEQHEAHFNNEHLDVGLRMQVGQMEFVAVLSGFRAIIADGLWLWGTVAWENTAWGQLKKYLDGATTLQPRALIFWEGAAGYMAWDASAAAMQDIHQPREALRLKARNEYYHLGEDYLLRGIQFNPDHALLFDRLGGLYRDKLKDNPRAYWAFSEAAKRPDTMSYTHRFAVYSLAACPGHEREAYDMLVALFKKGKEERLPTLLKLIRELQEKLQIPSEERIDISQDLREATPR